MTQDVATLPAQSLVAPLTDAVARGNVIVGAPPGAGKSTVLPLALLSQVAGKVLVMQPRRVVVRSLAGYLARLCGEHVGQTVGYRIRGENKTGAGTRLEIITEGILARLIQSDPELTGISAIVFDEYHERSIHSDFGLALALDVQAGLRDDLRLIIMSATLELAPLQSLMPDAQVLTTEGRTYPVTLHYSNDVPVQKILAQVTSTVRHALSAHNGDILVFLPGQGAINYIASQISGLVAGEGGSLHRLYGALPKDQQDAALVVDGNGRRKVILATNIAETSLTIEGIEVVIDSGLENIASFSPASGLTTLKQQRISQASAQQRAGRAGRVKAGHCYRLWSQASHERLAEHTPPQIKRQDVSPLILDAMNWGCELGDLAMLTQPDEAQINAAMHLLERIGAIDTSHKITATGRKIATVPCHPRLAAMLLRVAVGVKNMDTHTLRQAAPWVVALAEDSGRVEQLYVTDALAALSGAARSRLAAQAKRYARWCNTDQQRVSPGDLDAEAVAACVALAYPDCIGYRRGDSYKLASGKGATVSLTTAPQWLSVLQGQDVGSEVAIRLAQPIAQATLQQLFPGAFRQRDVVRYNAERQAMEARRVSGFDAIDITSEPIGNIPDERWVDSWLAYLSERDISDWPLGEQTWQWWHRLSLAAKLDLPIDDHGHNHRWPTSLTSLITDAKSSLAGKLKRCRRRRDLEALPWASLVHQTLPWPVQHALTTHLPAQITVPSGRSHPLHYSPDGQVTLAVRMQEMYGQSQPVTIAKGRVTVTLQLLSPAGRPLQTTSDPAMFWTGSYRAIQKEMKGRYPKHFWPDDPTTAKATTRTKKAMD